MLSRYNFPNFSVSSANIFFKSCDLPRMGFQLLCIGIQTRIAQVLLVSVASSLIQLKTTDKTLIHIIRCTIITAVLHRKQMFL
jgi:hypothetical protein